jgi:hypothetical protein
MATPQQEQQGSLAWKTACRITLAYLLVYIFAIVLQIITKKRLLRLESVKQGASKSTSTKVFDRYQNPGMLNADRAVGNLLEWTPVFWGLLWILVVVDDGGAHAGHMAHGSTTYYAAWAYVGFRFLYVILAHTGGIASDGKQTGLHASTYPAYACLLILLGGVIPQLLF